MLHWSAASSEITQLGAWIYLIHRAIAIASASEGLTQLSCHQLGDPVWTQPASLDSVQEIIHPIEHTCFANSWESELLFPACLSGHEEPAAAVRTTESFAGCPHEAWAMPTINHHINHQTAPSLIHRESQEPGGRSHNDLPENDWAANGSLEAIHALSASDQSLEASIENLLTVWDDSHAALVDKGSQEPSGRYRSDLPEYNWAANGSLEAINGLSASDQSQEVSIGNLLAVWDDSDAALIDGNFANFDFVKLDSYFNFNEDCTSFPGYISDPVSEWNPEDFLNPEYLRSDTTESSVTLAKGGHTTSPRAYNQGNQVGGDFNKEDKSGSPDHGQSTQKSSEDKIFEGVISTTRQNKGTKRKGFQSLESPHSMEDFEQNEQFGQKRKSSESDYPHSMENFEKLTFTDILSCEHIPQPIRDSLYDISKRVSNKVTTEDIRLKDNVFKKICSILRKNLHHMESVGSRDAHLSHKFTSYIEDPHSWYTYWNGLTKTVFRNSNHDNMTVQELTKMFPAFLQFVEMILTIIPWPKKQLELNQEEKLDFNKELKNAAQFFEDFKAYLMESVLGEDSRPDWTAAKDQFIKNFRKGKGEPVPTLWCVLELWMKTHYKIIWKALSENKRDALCQNVKTFFNNIFFHGIEEMTEKISRSK
ncbi:hypothetical protein PSTG_02679 [Puccinia striiformis f. sp. tritici PST-78]|uniref:Uncharacterized protein n=2 Tax=Puccinia striiformis TaxID=27350 RepID=A0A0L0VYR2_9BASI|nr:hypothetical protein PSTG_02679 [Puccinia striiformis f. sp. tritici PST-78]